MTDMNKYQELANLMHALRAELSNAVSVQFATQEQYHALFDYCELMESTADAVERDDDAAYRRGMDRLFDDTLTIMKGLEDGSITIMVMGGAA